MEKFIDFLQGLLIPSSIVILLAVLFTSNTIAEGMAAVILIFVMGFYYTEPTRLLVSGLPVLSDTPLAEWLLDYQRFILELLPNFKGISVFDKRFFIISVDEQFVPTYWPIMLLIAGIIVRVVLERYVRHHRLRQVGREYWLFITVYVILALMISNIIHWSFLKMMLASMVAVFIIAAGLFRVATDVITGFWSSLKVVRRFIKIVMMYTALLSARIAKILRNLVKFIRELYETYILEPFRRLYRAIQDFLENVENRVRTLLDQERLDD